MTDKITYKAILDRVEYTAKDILGEVVSMPQLPAPNDFSNEVDWEVTCKDLWEDFADKLEALLDGEARDYASESVDSWDWTIYTYQGFQVYDALSSSEQNDAEQQWEECGGYETAKDNSEGPYEIACRIAYFALVDMLTQEIERQAEDLMELAQNKLEQLA